MNKYCTFGLMFMVVSLSGCASYSPSPADTDEQIDLYLSTLDDKHFVWCKLDLDKCRKDFREWKLTSRGQALIREFEKEGKSQAYNRHQIPHVFRTRFIEKSQFEEVLGKNKVTQNINQETEELENMSSPLGGAIDSLVEEGPVSPNIYGPERPD